MLMIMANLRTFAVWFDQTEIAHDLKGLTDDIQN